LLLVGLVVAMVLWATLGPEDDAGTTSTTLGASTTAAGGAAPPAADLIAAVAAYDPAGNGEENDELAASLAEGGGPRRAVCYSSEFMGKPGVGLVVTLTEPATGTLSFEAGNAPYQIDVFASAEAEPPGSIDGW